MQMALNVITEGQLLADVLPPGDCAPTSPVPRRHRPYHARENEMRKLMCAGVLVLVLAGLAFGQPYRQFDLPKFLEPPILDGDRFTVADEWANAAGPFECSPEAIRADGEEFGWLDEATKNTVVSHDQLGTSESEDASIAMTNLDKKADMWFAWDDDGLYWIHEVRDNSRDARTDGDPASWWERDSVSIYIDLTEANEDRAAGDDYVSLNIVNMVAARSRPAA
jgi:hypothetical protein